MPESLVLRPNQQRAINTTGKNLFVVAGAGTGKTRVLVERYLRLLESHSLPSLVAITFTEKAAREMRDRVRDRIQARVDEGGPTATLWKEHLRQIDAARISTIHSLCAALLRANSAEAGVDPKFAVLDEADSQIWQEEALDAALAELAEAGGPELVLLKEYPIAEVRQTLALLLKHGGAAAEAMARVPADGAALYRAWQIEIEARQQQGLDKLRRDERWSGALRWVRANHATKSNDKLEEIRIKDQELAGRVDPADAAASWSALREIAAHGKVGSKGSRQNWKDLGTAHETLTGLHLLAKEYAGRYALELDDPDRRAADLIPLWSLAWARVHRHYVEHKASENVLDFDDLETETCALLSDHEGVRARYQSEFAAILVDEFQDTNAAQHQIIRDLANPEKPDRLFIVGDGKQSIYGFRGADVSVFTVTLDELVQRWGPEARIPLAESFRAHASLVRCVNALFTNIMAVDGDRAPFEIPYEELVAMRPSAAERSWIDVVQIPATRQINGEDVKVAADECRQWEAQEIAARLQALVTSRFQVWDKRRESYREARYGDMALLFRASTAVPLYEEAFKDARLPYITHAGKGYYDRPEVRDLIYLLRALDNPYDDLALATVLHSPLYALSSEILYRLRQTDTPLWDALAQPPAGLGAAERDYVEFAHQSLGRMREHVGRVTILDLLAHALADTGYLATVAGLADGARRRANVDKLIALARKTARVHLAEFNAYLENLTAQEVREGEALVDAEDAVQLMTIHRAKGLEFPIVVIPDAGRKLRDRSELLLADRDRGIAIKVRLETDRWCKPVAYRLMEELAGRRELAEEKRLLYVAMTRAQEYVLVCGSAEPDGESYLDQLRQAHGAMDDRNGISLCDPQVEFRTTPSTPGISERQPRENGPSTDEMGSPAADLAAPLSMPRTEDLASFTPTGLEMLRLHPTDLERRVLEGAPDRVPPLARRDRRAYAPATIVGDMAHRAIQHWRFPKTTPDLDAILRRYAQERGLVDDDVIRDAVDTVRRLLNRFTSSTLYNEMRQASIRRHEIPFVLRWQERMIHGTIDALYQTPAGEWMIVDFKTDRMRADVKARQHALNQYGAQLALYVQAAAEQFGHPVPVRVYYIHSGDMIQFEANDLAPILTELAEKLRGEATPT